jgi:hypothetical protein
MCVKWYYWNYWDNKVHKYFLRWWDDGRSPLLNEFRHGLCVVLINKITINAMNEWIVYRRNAYSYGCFMIPLFFDICRDMIGLVRLWNFLSAISSPLRTKELTKKYISDLAENSTAYSEALWYWVIVSLHTAYQQPFCQETMLSLKQKHSWSLPRSVF